MQVIDDLTRAQLSQDTVLTVGAFDGVHLGHQALVAAVVDRARATERLAAVVTFHPHPAAVFAPHRAPSYLTTPSERVALLEGLGVDLVALLPFNLQLAASPAREFVAMMAKFLRLRELWVGPDFALGRSREGDIALLREISPSLGYELRVIEPVSGQTPEAMAASGLEEEGVSAPVVVSSSRIRHVLREGRVADASRLLGRYYSLSGKAVPVPEQGTNPGSIAVNLVVPGERTLPAGGVYAVVATVDADRFAGAAMVGLGPGLAGEADTIDMYLHDCEPGVYGCRVVIEFVERLGDRPQHSASELQTDWTQRILADVRRILDSRLGARSPSREGHLPVDRPGVPCRFRHQEVEHMADRAIWVWGRELADLFAGAAGGMYSLMADIDGLAATSWRDVRLEGLDHETLLVEWLNELLFLTEVEGLLFVDYVILEITEKVITAQAGGFPGKAAKADIKAATFHDLEVVQDEDGWTAVVTFDV